MQSGFLNHDLLFWLYTPQILHKVFLMWKSSSFDHSSIQPSCCCMRPTSHQSIHLCVNRSMDSLTPQPSYSSFHESTSHSSIKEPALCLPFPISLCSSRQPTSRQVSKYSDLLHQIYVFSSVFSLYFIFYLEWERLSWLPISALLLIFVLPFYYYFLLLGFWYLHKTVGLLCDPVTLNNVRDSHGKSLDWVFGSGRNTLLAHWCMLHAVMQRSSDGNSCLFPWQQTYQCGNPHILRKDLGMALVM